MLNIDTLLLVGNQTTPNSKQPKPGNGDTVFGCLFSVCSLPSSVGSQNFGSSGQHILGVGEDRAHHKPKQQQANQFPCSNKE